MVADELRARQLLLDMQERLGRDPFEALGLKSSDPGEVRTAFLKLTKIYHPARFARMAGEIQRLSNEVFLGLRAAHDAMTRPQVRVPAARSTDVIPVFRPPPTARARTPSTGSIPGLRPPPTPPPASQPARGTGSVSRPATPTAPGRTTPAHGQPIIRRSQTPTTPGRTTPAQDQPIMPARTTTGTRPPPGTQPIDPSRPNRLPSSSPPPPTISGSGRFAATPAMPARPSGATPVLSGGDPELAVIHELLAQDRLTDARMKLETLVTRQPGVPKYQALIHYAKGREAQLAGRRDEARLELLDALDLDRDLQFANTALGELLTKRK